jgi:hypothetical protein
MAVRVGSELYFWVYKSIYAQVCLIDIKLCKDQVMSLNVSVLQTAEVCNGTSS